MRLPQDFTSLYKTAVENKDKQLMCSLYHKNIVFYDVWNDFSLNGIANITSMINSWFDSISSENVLVDFENSETIFDGSAGFSTCSFKFSAQSDQGVEIRHIKERMTVCFIKENEEWFVTNQHTSVPIHMDTGLGIF
ncbi:nuclear transport factor 2 family protein [Treponema zuelzerae]|uniref:Nuclear transport factor 2 family protein n=1 Tax=Teretinema zuelzerae TaxID=156 RepID=A0AAE3EGS5_9SPIR|nr:nuclear transport factor 2 family protein [Teretinema zuelzerae]MCD1653553.1 nuclear transport factor 2 family protein [Teretinema zuelzerae]